MAIARDASSANRAAGAWLASGSGPFTWNHTPVSATNGYIIVAVFIFGVARTVTGVTCAGNPMASLGNKAVTDTLSVWGIPSAGLGTGALAMSVAVSGAISTIECFADSFTGVAQTSSTGTVTNNSNTTAGLTCNATLPSGGAVVGCFAHHYTTVWTVGQTLCQQSGTVSSVKGRTLATEISTATGNMTYTSSGTFGWEGIAVPLNVPAASDTLMSQSVMKTSWKNAVEEAKRYRRFLDSLVVPPRLALA